MLNLAKEVFECKRCEQFLADRSKGIRPIFMEGNFGGKIWVVGLNPKLEREGEVLNDFDSYITKWQNSEFRHPFFKKVQFIFPEGVKWGRDVAHVDLVKCATKGINKDFGKLVSKCGHFLKRQIRAAKPKLIIADGIPVCQWFKNQKWGEAKQNDTSILFSFDDFETLVVLSGFIGRIDQYSKARLKQEFQRAIEELGLGR